MKTLKIKSSDVKTQGDFVIINECDFDKEKHELFSVAKPKVNKPTKAKPVASKVES